MKVNLLLIEDNEGDILLIKRYLATYSMLDITVFAVSSMQDAKNFPTASSIDIVLLDLSLPDSIGLETFLQIKESYNKVPIVILTGLDDILVSISCLREGAQDFVVKDDNIGKVLGRSLLYSLERYNNRRQFEDTLRKTAQLEIIKSFVDEVAHDFRTPLSVILTSAYLIKRLISTESDKVYNHLSLIEEKASSLSELVDILLEISKLDFELYVFKNTLERLHISKMIEDAFNELETRITQKSLTLQTSFTTSGQMEGDRELIKRCLTLMASSMVDYADVGSVIHVHINSTSREVLIRISCQHENIEDHSLQNMFEFFNREDKTRSLASGYNGLALGLVRQIIQIHQGSIRAEGIDNRVLFNVVLPTTYHPQEKST